MQRDSKEFAYQALQIVILRAPLIIAAGGFLVLGAGGVENSKLFHVLLGTASVVLALFVLGDASWFQNSLSNSYKRLAVSYLLLIGTFFAHNLPVQVVFLCCLIVWAVAALVDYPHKVGAFVANLRGEHQPNPSLHTRRGLPDRIGPERVLVFVGGVWIGGLTLVLDSPWSKLSYLLLGASLCWLAVMMILKRKRLKSEMSKFHRDAGPLSGDD